MLAKRIIPCLDVRDGRVVKGVKFLNLRDAGDPVEIAGFYEKEGADEIVFLDITASHEKRKIILDVVKKTAQQVFMPLTVGGGIKTIEDIRNLLASGADKVSLNTAAVDNPDLIKKAAKQFGQQCIVVAVDAKKSYPVSLLACCPVKEFKNDRQIYNRQTGKLANRQTVRWQVYTHGGRTPTGIDVLEWVKQAEGLGAGEILLTSMDCDGTKNGYDLELTRAVSEAVNIPVIASGGAGNLEHLYEAFKKGKADAVLAASIFHYREFTINQAKKYLAKKGVPIRH